MSDDASPTQDIRDSLLVPGLVLAGMAVGLVAHFAEQAEIAL